MTPPHAVTPPHAMTPVRPRSSRLAAGLAALLLVAACGGGSESESPGDGRGPGATVQAQGSADAQTATVVSNDQKRYDPGVVEAAVGTLTLTHENGGAVPHNLVFDDEALGAIATVTEGQSKDIVLTFDTPGTYDFVCTFHPGQVGRVVIS